MDINKTETIDNIPNESTMTLRKKIKPQTVSTKTSRLTTFNYIEYFKEIKEQLVNYKLTELKEIAKYNKIKGTKTKQEYITKIHEHFVKIKCIVKIQSICRGFFVRLFFKVKGSLKNRNKCVNDTDFYTLEPLDEIEFTNFFIIREINKCENVTETYNSFYYGFNIHSLITMYRKNNTFLNPYNRQKLNINTIQNIFTHYHLLLLFFKNDFCCKEKDTIDNIIKFKIPTKHQIYYLFDKKEYIPRNIQSTRNSLNSNNEIITTPIQSPRLAPPTHTPRENETMSIEVGNLEPIDSITNNGENERIVIENIRNTITIFKRQPVNTRINELFIYIDQLGNYTNAMWFSGLNKYRFYGLYSQLKELWTFQAQIPNEIKNKICPLGDPFNDSIATYRKPYEQITIDEMRLACLDVIENIIMTSTDIEYRKIGCLHVLTALTIISTECRIQYRFLFEAAVRM